MDWTKEWPTTPGFYWFFGPKYSRDKRTTTHLVEVWPSKPKPTYVLDGNFLYQEDGGKGLWAPAEIPKPPKDLVDQIIKGVKNGSD